MGYTKLVDSDPAYSVPPVAGPRLLNTDRHRLLCSILRDARKDAQVSQVQLATQLARPQNFVSKYENNGRHLGALDFIDICTALRVSVADIAARLESATAEAPTLGSIAAEKA